MFALTKTLENKIEQGFLSRHQEYLDILSDFDSVQAFVHVELLKKESQDALRVEKRMTPEEATEHLESAIGTGS